VYSSVAVDSAKSNAKRLRQQDGGTLDLHRQSLRQHGLLHDRDSVGGDVGVGGIVEAGNEEAVKAESKRRKEEARMREVEEIRKMQAERNSFWNWIRGK
jgi:hypothetical protein